MDKALIIFRIFLYTCLSSLAMSVNAQDTTIMTQIKRLESQLPGVVENNDVEALDKLMHPEFTVQSSEGHLVRKSRLLENFRNGRNPYLKFRPQMDSLVVVNDNLVITSGKETFVHKPANKHNEEVRFFYHVWVKNNTSWLWAGRVIAAIPKK